MARVVEPWRPQPDQSLFCALQFFHIAMTRPRDINGEGVGTRKETVAHNLASPRQPETMLSRCINRKGEITLAAAMRHGVRTALTRRRDRECCATSRPRQRKTEHEGGITITTAPEHVASSQNRDAVAGARSYAYVDHGRRYCITF
jgi:hypothetical protein